MRTLAAKDLLGSTFWYPVTTPTVKIRDVCCNLSAPEPDHEPKSRMNALFWISNTMPSKFGNIRKFWEIS